MKRIGTVIVLAIFVVIAKFGTLVSLSWEHLRIVGELAMVWLIYDLVRSPVTQFITRQLPLPHTNKMIVVQAARVSGRSLKLHLKSGAAREGFVLAHSLSRGSFALTDSPHDKTTLRYYDAGDIDELTLTPKPEQRIALTDEPAFAENTTS